MFFFFVQTEQGDLFKITMSYETDIVKSLKIKYFDTIPMAKTLLVLKTGYLFATSEFGNQYVGCHQVYMIT